MNPEAKQPVMSKFTKKKIIKPKAINRTKDYKPDKSHLDSEIICTTCAFKNKNCICQSFWETFEEDMAKTEIYKNIKPSVLSISTMTFGFYLLNTVIDLQKIADNFQKTTFTRSIKFKQGSKKSKKNEDLNFRFYNQCSITSYVPCDKNPDKFVKLSIKIFHNGSFNFTGAKSVKTIVYATRNIIKYLSNIPGVIQTVGKLIIHDTRIRMINSNFGIHKKIRLKLLNESLQSFNDKRNSCKLCDKCCICVENRKDTDFVKMSNFNPEKYNAVRISFLPTPYNPDLKTVVRMGVEKMENEFTISVFNSGNIIINGGNTSTDTMIAYNWINKYLDDNYSGLIKEFDDDYKPKKKIHRVYYKTDIMKDLLSEIKQDRFDKHRVKMKETLLNVQNVLYEKDFSEFKKKMKDTIEYIKSDLS